MELTLSGASQLWKAVIDDAHANPLQAWKDMGSPDYLTAEQVLALHKASELKFEPVPFRSDSALQNAMVIDRFTAEPESVTIYKAGIKQ